MSMAGGALIRLTYNYTSENKACAQEVNYFLKELERPLEVPKIGDVFWPTPASEDLCQGSHPRLRTDGS